jgi:hypothetical protein
LVERAGNGEGEGTHHREVRPLEIEYGISDDSGGTLCIIFAGTSHDIVKNGPLHFLENHRAVLHSFWHIDNAAFGNSVFLIVQPELHFTA